MIKKEEVKHIAKLARISLTEEETKKFQEEISSILDYFKLLQKTNTEKASPIFHSTQEYFKENAHREDKAVLSGAADNLLKLAPAKNGRYIKVKSIF